MPEPAGHYDVIVIGGGINGAGIARDAAMRGLSVLLLEAADFGGGTSSWSSRLIHGGLRYLEYGEIPLVYESLHERRHLRRIAGHLVKPLRLLIPLYRGGKRGPWLVRLGLAAYDLLSIGKSLPRHRMLSRDEVRRAAPGIEANGLLAGARYFDAQVSFAERLVIENVIAAAAAGAALRNYAAVTGLRRKNDGRHEVTFGMGNRELHATANGVVNAAGPWVDKVLGSSDCVAARLMGGTKGSHIIIDPFPGAAADACYVEAASDGRPVFIIPWNGQYLVGTTDIRYAGDPREARASATEIDYLLDTVNALFPKAGLTRASINFSYAGVRPLPYNPSGPESAITRRHIIHRHRDGLYSIIGGKLTTYRHLAEQVVDRLAKDHGQPLEPCRTAETPLPGGGEANAAVLDDIPQLTAAARKRLLSLYGSRVARLVELAAGDPAQLALVDAHSGLVAAEVRLAVRDERAQTLTDLFHRRLMIGLDRDQGGRLVAPVAALAARELGWDRERIQSECAALRAYNERLQVAAG